MDTKQLFEEMSRMKRRYAVLAVLLILALLITSCHTSDMSDASEPSGTSPFTYNTVSSKEDYTEDDPRPKVIWAVHITAYISEETQAEIQRFLDDKGIDCRVEFTPRIDLLNEEYVEWLDERKKDGTTPDILSGCLWQHGIVDLVPFVQKELLPLNSYLVAEEDKKLYNSYAKVEWDRTAVNGTIYSIPLRQRKQQNTQGKYFLCVKDEYKSFFDEDFDGTYASLQKIMENIPDLPKIAMLPRVSLYLVASLFQISEVTYSSYHWKSNEIVDLTKQVEFQELLQDIYSDYQRGVLIDIATMDQVAGNACAFIGFSGDGYDYPEGYTEYVLAPELYLSSPGSGSYGISAFSEKKDLAFQVLSACYSDPRIASLLFWRTADEDRWNERTQFLGMCDSSAFTGFIPDITPEEFLILQSYENDLRTLIESFYLKQGKSYVLNPNFPDLVDQFFSSPHDYGSVMEKVNEQLQDWIDKKQ